ncbi:hypothetical protein KII98_07130 [Leuconostoc gelidum subsp. gasicomitatum]|nr:hypothetical protein [Leuconostoc gasicomitatum]MBZ5953709.1 hypothetical protein [Leuconostoc gasicomitatum]MBZ5954830.1 hypothetical protein [Leuconostoc gasicomitatum]MBZ5988957.1 hypothetical protein [Leuconostoc gasicomitatum]MBZ5989734.1 hypothetical protein [Leuconostoc gasicomitatum]CUR64314.1 Uncharacterized protein LEKG_1727 [Leuconostoc gasicomitatum KG16-1]
MTVSNDELMEELAELKWQLTQDRHVWKRAENVAKHFDVSLGTVKSWKRRGLITGYKHDKIVIYDVNAIERDLFQVEN